MRVSPERRTYDFAKTLVFEEEGEKVVSYIGDSKHGEKNGQGVATYGNGDMYDGEWEKDMRQGVGRYTYVASDATYEGEWAKNLKHGAGTVVLNSGIKLKGSWVGDELQ
jgi:radial spoke head protein 1